MIKQAPSPGRIAAMIVFALSCFGIVLYLWVSFGGSTPLKAKGYRFTADFREATLIAQNADVRISGVSVGKVVKTKQEPGITRMTLEMKSKYAPVPRDTRAIPAPGACPTAATCRARRWSRRSSWTSWCGSSTTARAPT